MEIIWGLLYVALIVLSIIYLKNYFVNIMLITFCYLIMLALLYKFHDTINGIWEIKSILGSYITKWDLKEHLYLAINIGLILLGISLLIYLLFRERRKREPYRMEKWGSFKEYITRDGIIPILISLLIIILGMVGAGFVNILSTEFDSSFELMKFIFSGSVGIIIIFIGLGIISPLVEFKFRYGFLKNYASSTAKFIYHIRNRSENIKNTNVGVISFQFFELTKTTSENNIVYEFKEIWRNDSKYDKIKRFKPKKIFVPFQMIEFFKSNNIDQMDISQLNRFTTKKIVGKLSTYRVYVSKIYLRALYDLLFELFYKEKEQGKKFLFQDIDELKSNDKVMKEFDSWIDAWHINKKVFNKNSSRYKSVHYINLFEFMDFLPIEFENNTGKENDLMSVKHSPKISVLFDELIKEISDSNNEEKDNLKKRIEWIKRWHKKDISKIEQEKLNDNKGLVNFSLLRNYKGGDSKKKHRGYYNLCIETENSNEGKRKFVLLLIADTRAIDEQAALNLFKNVLQLDMITLGGDEE